MSQICSDHGENEYPWFCACTKTKLSEMQSKLTAAQTELDELRKLVDRQYLGRDMIEKNLKDKLTAAQAEIERLKSLLKLVMVQITPEMLLEIYDLIVLIRNFKSSITTIDGKEKP